VAAAEREKKKIHDPAVSGEADKRLALKKRPLETTDRVKQLAVKEKEPDDAESSVKRRGLIQSWRLTRMSTF
jgi:hypothetical protein